MAGRDKELRPGAEYFYGVKPTRFPTVFEALINAFSNHQVSLDLSIILRSRLSSSCGAAFFNSFPRPEDLAGLSPEDFRKLGFSQNRGTAIIELSVGMIRGNLAIESLEKMTAAEIVQYLSKIRGFGRWSAEAEYVLLRDLGRLHIFLGDNEGAQRNPQNFMGLEARPDYEKIKKITARAQPYASFVYFHYLLVKLKNKSHPL